MKFIIGNLKDGEPLRARELAKSIKKKFNKDVHPRSIERAIARRVKKGEKK